MVDDKMLLDFDTSNLAHWSLEQQERCLREHPELYRNHLMIAKQLDMWVENLDRPADDEGARFDKGFIHGLREVAAHLRQGDYLPDGSFIVNMTGR